MSLPIREATPHIGVVDTLLRDIGRGESGPRTDDPQRVRPSPLAFGEAAACANLLRRSSRSAAAG